MQTRAQQVAPDAQTEALRRRRPQPFAITSISNPRGPFKFSPAFPGRNQPNFSLRLPETYLEQWFLPNPGISKYFQGFRSPHETLQGYPTSFLLLIKSPCGSKKTRGHCLSPSGRPPARGRRFFPSRRSAPVVNLSPIRGPRPASPRLPQYPADAGSPAPPRWRPTSPRATSGKVRS